MVIQLNKERAFSFLARFVFPTLVTICLFLTAIFLIIIPAMEKNSIDSKRELIRELTLAIENNLTRLDADVRQGVLTREAAQRKGIELIRNQHYGRDAKGYFWINDLQPKMIFHPYRADLIGKDLGAFRNADGKAIFIEMADLVREKGDGYLEYNWQWKNEEHRVVPKISYVRGFAPWGWVIGTGIYLDDVKEEISKITGNIIQISLFILLLISFILIFIDNQSYKAMRKQYLAELALRESEEKYRTLVESAAEGMFMVMERVLMYANQTFAEMFGYPAAELRGMRTDELFPELESDCHNGHLRDLLAGLPVPERFEALLENGSGKCYNVTLSATPISLGGKSGFMAVVSDITFRKRMESELRASEEKFRTMAMNLNLGFFRIVPTPNWQFLEANPALAELLGYDSREQLLGQPVEPLFTEPLEYRRLLGPLSDGEIQREIVTIGKRDGGSIKAAVWGKVVLDGEGQVQAIDGIMEDITPFAGREEANGRLFNELQAMSVFFQQRLADIPVRQLTGSGAVTTPLPILPRHASVLDAWDLMSGHGVSQLCVADERGGVIGSILKEDIMAIQQYTPAVLVKRIGGVVDPGEICRLNSVQPYIISNLLVSGANPLVINSLTTTINDAVRKRLIQLAILELGEPPVPFAFMVFGSEGREEQTLHTDQDNAIIYADLPPEREAPVRVYFQAVASRVCQWLDDAGYSFCKGNNMAMNPEFCCSLSTWKRNFGNWVFAVTGENLLRTKIFFDFRHAYGDETLVRQLREHQENVISENAIFLLFLARDMLNFCPPIGRFGKLSVQTSGKQRGGLDIKKAMVPFVDFARIYALKHGIRVANTIKRFDALKELKVLTPLQHKEMVQSYTFLMQMRLRIQTDTVLSGCEIPDNIVYPEMLTVMERQLLKEIFTQTKNYQTRLSYDFTGQPGNI